ncbi:DUF6148 family protein [Brevibacillus brevis]|uniref:DUF6148 family protein n=1 Tax=Brevibacillus brevis TaxID=1393 RepID=UPI000D0F1CF4|nr:DUF6148 family protein [Brevibacillus brevis]PSJ66615.1 hypothetical protein C7J99_24830 [Brevibacillus brevis]RED20917.1 hypothetical protein DES34_12817 [Brevibacillus brevis]VEF86628.1 Uncharacterised protein [Brevibacillus brevis]
MAYDPRQQNRLQDELEIVKDRLNKYYEAETAILKGAQEYRIGSRNLRRGDLKLIKEEIEKLQDRKNELENSLATGESPSKRKAFRVIYRDL